MDIQEKSKLGLRILKYFKSTGYEIQLTGRERDYSINAPSVFVYKLTGDWRRGFQEKTAVFKYRSDSYEITHEKFLAKFAEWYCSPGAVEHLQHLMITSNGKVYTPTASSLEELSLNLAVHGY